MDSSEPDGLLQGLPFDNRFVRELSADPVPENRPRQVFGAHFSRVEPLRVAHPRLVAQASEVADLLGLGPQQVNGEDFLSLVSGHASLPGMDPFAMCYGGHQFGHWAGQLGDGRAINLGELKTSTGHWTLQLKGAGPTPYSRTADGLAVLRSSVREFLCSEAMQHLGVPTTRALGLVLSGERVLRDMFYDGNARMEPGAIVCRVAPSFVRFGSLQIFRARGDEEGLRALLEHVIRADFSHLGKPNKEAYIRWFEEVCARTMGMIVHWMRVGFVHGVMNTDNMSVLGLTIDYGPYGWLEGYDSNWTPNTTDAEGKRYAFGQQAQVALWNLAQLANAIHPLVLDEEALGSCLQEARDAYIIQWNEMMCSKLGLAKLDVDLDPPMIQELLLILELVETDMTIFFRQLAKLDLAAKSLDSMPEALLEAYYDPAALDAAYQERMLAWLGSYGERLSRDTLGVPGRRARMDAVNPKYVLRNWLVQGAIDRAEEGDFEGILELQRVMREPYAEQTGNEAFAQRRPEWARSRAGCSMLSCSS